MKEIIYCDEPEFCAQEALPLVIRLSAMTMEQKNILGKVIKGRLDINMSNAVPAGITLAKLVKKRGDD